MIKIMIKFYISMFIIGLITNAIDGKSQLSKRSMKDRMNRKNRHNSFRIITVDEATGKIEVKHTSTSGHNITLSSHPNNMSAASVSKIPNFEGGRPQTGGPFSEMKSESKAAGTEHKIQPQLLPRNMTKEGPKTTSTERPEELGKAKTYSKLQLKTPNTGGIEATLESLPKNITGPEPKKTSAEKGLSKTENAAVNLESKPPGLGGSKIPLESINPSNSSVIEGHITADIKTLPRNMTGLDEQKITNVQARLPRTENADGKLLKSPSSGGETTLKSFPINTTGHVQKIKLEKASPKGGNTETDTKHESKSLATGGKTPLESITENKPKITTSQNERLVTDPPHFSTRKTRRGKDGLKSNATTNLVTKKAKTGGRIINGTRAGHIPFLVSLQAQNATNKKWRHGCGGSILTTTVVLTACHCIGMVVGDQMIYGNNKLIRVVAGTESIVKLSPEAQIRKVKKLVRHPKSSNNPETDSGWFINDVSVIVVESPFVFNKMVQPMKLYSHSKQRAIGKLKQMVDQGQTCMVPGWGSTEEFKLKLPEYQLVSKVKLIPDDSCRQIFCERTKRHCHTDFMSIGQVCGISRESSDCQGDSGGPLLCNGLVFGIVSYGERCVPGWPSVFQGIGPIMELIENYTQQHRWH